MVISININRYIIVDEEFIADKYIEQTGWCIDPLGTPFSIYKPEIYAGTSMPLLPDRKVVIKSCFWLNSKSNIFILDMW